MNASNIYKELALTILRALLTSASAWFISRGLLTEGQATAAIPEVAVGVLGVLVTLGWALWTRIQHHVGFLAALELPAQSTPKDVAAAVSTLSIGEKWEVAKGTQEPPTVT